MLLKLLFNQFRLQDEVVADTGNAGGGGNTPDLHIDIDKASDAIGLDLGLGDPDKGAGADDEDLGSATPPKDKKEALAPQNDAAKEAREKAAKATADAAARVKSVAEARTALKAKNTPDLDKKTDDEVLAMVAPAPKAAPKSWPKEKHAIYSALPPEAQAFIDQREAEQEAGFKQYGADSTYAKSVRSALEPYAALLTAQGVQDHGVAVKAVMNAHYVLSTAPEDKKAEFFANLAKNYQVNMTKATEAYGKSTPAESDEAKSLRLRMEALEGDRTNERQQAFTALKAKVAAEVEAFASDPAHPYFKEVAKEVALMLNDPDMTIAAAYEAAVFANPITRAKELERLNKEATEKTRKEDEEKAAAALKARGTKIKGDERERASPDLLGSMEDTMRETLTNIRNRQDK